MAKNLLPFVICAALLWTGGYGLRLSGMDFNDDYLDREAEAEDINGVVNEQDRDAKLAETCLIQILSPSVTCIMRSLSKWNVDPYQLKKHINNKPTCCSIWEMTDCLKAKAQIYCTEEEKTAFEAHMNTQTEHRNEKNCSHFQYGTHACNAVHQELSDTPIQSVMVNNVKVHENNHFVTNELEEEPVPKVHYTKLSKANPGAKKVIEDVQAGLDELNLAQRLMDRVNRITVNQIVIELHPVGHKVAKHEQGNSEEIES